MTGPSASEVIARYVEQYSANSPRTRLTIVTYLLEAGVTTNVVEEAQAILTFIGEGMDDFKLEIEATTDPSSAVLDEDAKDTQSSSGYL